MELRFLGGAQTVTGSRFLLVTEQARVLVDCGLFQGSPNEEVRNRIPLGFNPGRVDAILLTHAHLDHCGLLPVAVREGYQGPIFATAATIELAELILLDSGRLQQEFAKRSVRRRKRDPDREALRDRRVAHGYEAALEAAASTPGPRDAGTGPSEDPEETLRAQPPTLDLRLDRPLYTEEDAMAVLPRFRRVTYGAEIPVAPGVAATFLDAGHILGSAIIRLRVRDRDSGPERILVFSGDLGRPNTPIIRDPATLTDADHVIVESTYGGREHEPHDEAVRALAGIVRLVAESKGVLLVPAFAIGRTQEIVWELDRLIELGEIPLLPLYLDSPMASRASDIYRRYPGEYDDETRALLDQGASPLDYPRQVITRTPAQSQAIRRARRPYMIVASNGMLSGGRVLTHLRNLVSDPNATILFVGYQGAGTLGAHLQAGAKTVTIDGEVRPVRCRVRSISGFSAHADEGELLAWLDGFRRVAPDDPSRSTRVFLVHGDPDAQLALEPRVRALGFTTHVPRWHERVALE